MDSFGVKKTRQLSSGEEDIPYYSTTPDGSLDFRLKHVPRGLIPFADLPYTHTISPGSWPRRPFQRPPFSQRPSRLGAAKNLSRRLRAGYPQRGLLLPLPSFPVAGRSPLRVSEAGQRQRLAGGRATVPRRRVKFCSLGISRPTFSPQAPPQTRDWGKQWVRQAFWSLAGATNKPAAASN